MSSEEIQSVQTASAVSQYSVGHILKEAEEKKICKSAIIQFQFCYISVMKRRKLDFYLCWNIVVVAALAVFIYIFISNLW